MESGALFRCCGPQADDTTFGRWYLLIASCYLGRPPTSSSPGDGVVKISQDATWQVESFLAVKVKHIKIAACFGQGSLWSHEQISCYLFPVCWLVNRDPYDGVLQSPRSMIPWKPKATRSYIAQLKHSIKIKCQEESDPSICQLQRPPRLCLATW